MRALQTEPPNEEVVSRSIQMDADLASWLDREACVMGISPSLLVSTLLDWARTEQITRDEDMVVFRS